MRISVSVTRALTCAVSRKSHANTPELISSHHHVQIKPVWEEGAWRLSPWVVSTCEYPYAVSHLTSYSSSFLDDFFFLSKRVWPCEISSSSVHDITLPWYPVKFTSVIIYQQTCQVFGFFCTGVLEYKLFRSTPKERIFFNFHKTAEEPFDAWIWDDLRRSSEVWYAQTLPGISRGHPHFLQKVNGEYLGGGMRGGALYMMDLYTFPISVLYLLRTLLKGLVIKCAVFPFLSSGVPWNFPAQYWTAWTEKMSITWAFVQGWCIEMCYPPPFILFIYFTALLRNFHKLWTSQLVILIRNLLLSLNLE